MRVRQLAITILLGVICTSAFGQVELERVLVPIWFPTPLPGALGSLWKTEITIVNGGSTAVPIYGWDTGCRIGVCPPPPPTPPQVTFSPSLYFFTTEVQGVFLRVERQNSRSVHFSLRVRDLSRQAENWGAEVPVVRENDFFDEGLNLLDIPMRPEFRHTLRIYDADPLLGPAQVRVRVFGTNPQRTMPFDNAAPAAPDPLLITETHSFVYATTGGGSADHPGYIQLGDLTQRPELTGYATVRVEVQMLTTGHQYWAFASITNNNTQHVTIVSPQ